MRRSVFPERAEGAEETIRRRPDVSFIWRIARAVTAPT